MNSTHAKNNKKENLNCCLKLLFLKALILDVFACLLFKRQRATNAVENGGRKELKDIHTVTEIYESSFVVAFHMLWNMKHK